MGVGAELTRFSRTWPRFDAKAERTDLGGPAGGVHALEFISPFPRSRLQIGTSKCNILCLAILFPFTRKCIFCPLV